MVQRWCRAGHRCMFRLRGAEMQRCRQKRCRVGAEVVKGGGSEEVVMRWCRGNSEVVVQRWCRGRSRCRCSSRGGAENCMKVHGVAWSSLSCIRVHDGGARVKR